VEDLEVNDETTPPEDLPTTKSADSPSRPPTRVGPYRILQKIGEGGMGEVYEAEQEAPVRRKVALKIIKWGMDTKKVVARFEAERQALAMMNHPNIAKVFDAGATDRGRPYFVMEFIKGVPITEHCDRQRLTNQERLELFAHVCEGVQHAHQKAVIHRDIKPANILVAIEGGNPVPKIIDFGVAKATEQRLTERTLFTELGQLVGTPEYMSPEQAEMTVQDIDTRTDVYSLGVVLYELLVGALPFEPRELREAGFDEIRRRIREVEPSKPSAKVSTLGDASTESANNRRTNPSGLAKQLRGDLDWITLKAMEKERGRRYGSPAELVADIERHLTSQPVLAGPPSAAYRARKFVRRHRFGVTAGTVAVLALIAFSVTMAVLAHRIDVERRATEVERQQAEAAKSDLEQVVDFQAGMLSEVDAEQVGRRLFADLRERVSEALRERGSTEPEIDESLSSFDLALGSVNATGAALRLIDEEILGRAVEALETRFSHRPTIDARLRHTIGMTYRNLGLYERATPQLEAAVEARKRVLGPDHPDTLESVQSVALLYMEQGRYDEAEPLYLESLEAQKRVLGSDHPDTMRSTGNLAHMYQLQGRHDEAEPLYLESLESHERVLGPDHPDTLTAKHNLSTLYWAQGRQAEADSLLQETLETQRRVLGPDHPDTLWSLRSLAATYSMQGRYAEAETLDLEILEANERALGQDHPDTLRTMQNLAAVYERQKRYDEAETLTRQVLEARRRVLGVDHRESLNSLNMLANLHNKQGRYAEAELLFLEALEAQQREIGEDHPDTIRTLGTLAVVYAQQERYDEAAAMQLEALDASRRVLGEEHPRTLRLKNNLALMLDSQGRHAEAEPLLLETLETRKRVLGNDHPETVRTLYNLARLEVARGDRARAFEYLRQAIDAGFAVAENLTEDPVFESIRGPEFDTVVERARQNAAAQKAEAEE
jgi:non-specific serine/threonine protein kinase/serine/threonine-protein kinase